MFHIVLFQPQIPPNTGNAIRLCANTGAWLHLIHPLGFRLEDAKLRRAGLDYHEYAQVQEHDSLDQFLSTVQPKRVWACSTKGGRCYADVTYQAGDALLFGPETQGLPQHVLEAITPARVLRIPMRADNRSLNLSNSVAIILFEAWRQQDFAGGQ